MNVADFDYHLPTELIAQKPLEPRDSSRLMVVDRQRKIIRHRTFRDILEYLNPGDCLVVNNARVLPARLRGKKAVTGGNVELLLLKEVEPGRWEALVKPGRRLPEGTVVGFGGGLLTAVIEKRVAQGKRLVTFEYKGRFEEVLSMVGNVPLPPYIHQEIPDPSRYQTVYASKGCAVAAPTAGLHFTEDLLREAEERQIKLAQITLDVGLDSFRPVQTLQIEEHKMHSEKFFVSKESAALVNDTIEKGKRVFSAGTTSARVLESVAIKENKPGRAIQARQGNTGLFIYPGYEFEIVDGLLTNFHLPKSTLLMLVCAFASRELIMEAYRQAVEGRYRFFSFGDAMLII